jgi:hypothetical protein
VKKRLQLARLLRVAAEALPDFFALYQSIKAIVECLTELLVHLSPLGSKR